jgi:hypothetical protein
MKEAEEQDGLSLIIIDNKSSIFRQSPLTNVCLLQSAISGAIAFQIHDPVYDIR